MRVSDKTVHTNALDEIQNNRSHFLKSQREVATMKKFDKISDQPADHLIALNAHKEMSKLGQFYDTNILAKNFLQMAESSLTQLGDIVARARELAMSAATGTAGAVGRRGIAQEVNQLRQSVLGLANTRFGNRYLFGGFKTDEAPFTPDGIYKGDNGEMNVEIANGTYVSMNIPGSEVFFKEEPREAQFKYQAITGEKIPGVRENKPEEQLAPPLTENEDSKVKENETGASRNLASTEVVVDKKVKDENQKKINSNNPPEVDEQNKIDPNFVPAKDPATKKSEIFQSLEKLEISLESNDDEGIRATMLDLDGNLNQVVHARAKVGARLMQVERADDSISQKKTDVTNLVGKIEDLDYEQAISNLARNETLMKASLQTAGKVMQPSLLDFIR